MKYALQNNAKVVATPGATGTCACCGSALVAKCGSLKVWHWAHKSKKNCDHWWENETQWHRNWKNKFAEDWQEIVQISEDGEKHIADVKTPAEFVIEFQHSPISPSERISREEFYGDMCWIVDATRLKSDAAKFNRAPTLRNLSFPTLLSENVPVDFFPSLLKWYSARPPVFFDFGNKLFCILPTSEHSMHRLMFSVSHSKFVEIVSNSDQKLIDFEQIVRAEPNFEYLRIS